jgi:hypothetical protein
MWFYGPSLTVPDRAAMLCVETWEMLLARIIAETTMQSMRDETSGESRREPAVELLQQPQVCPATRNGVRPPWHSRDSGCVGNTFSSFDAWK